MNKFIAALLIICSTYQTSQCWRVGINFLRLASSQHFLSILKFDANPEINEQLGRELDRRGYFDNTTIVHEIIAPVTEKPEDPPIGTNFNEGQWVWLPVPRTVGRWIWIVRDNTAFVRNMLTTLSLYNS